jgi:hypothetical protein
MMPLSSWYDPAIFFPLIIQTKSVRYIETMSILLSVNQVVLYESHWRRDIWVFLSMAWFAVVIFLSVPGFPPLYEPYGSDDARQTSFFKFTFTCLTCDMFTRTPDIVGAGVYIPFYISNNCVRYGCQSWD